MALPFIFELVRREFCWFGQYPKVREKQSTNFGVFFLTFSTHCPSLLLFAVCDAGKFSRVKRYSWTLKHRGFFFYFVSRITFQTHRRGTQSPGSSFPVREVVQHWAREGSQVRGARLPSGGRVCHFRSGGWRRVGWARLTSGEGGAAVMPVQVPRQLMMLWGAKVPLAVFLHPYIVRQKAFGWVSWKIWALIGLKLLLRASGYFCHRIQNQLGIGMNPVLHSIDLYHYQVFCLVHLNRKQNLGIYTLKE